MASKKANYTIRLNKDEKDEWVKFSKDNYNNNLARMIRVAVNQLINGIPETNIDLQLINTSVKTAIEKSNLADSLNRVEERLDIISSHIAGVDPKVLEILDLMTEGYTQEKSNKVTKRKLKHDF